MERAETIQGKFLGYVAQIQSSINGEISALEFEHTNLENSLVDVHALLASAEKSLQIGYLVESRLGNYAHQIVEEMTELRNHAERAKDFIHTTRARQAQIEAELDRLKAEQDFLIKCRKEARG